ERNDFVRHIEALRFSVRSITPRREQDSDAATRTEVQGDLTRIQFRKGRGITAPQRRLQSLFGYLSHLFFIVKSGRNRICRSATRTRSAAGTTAVQHTQRGFCVFFFYGLFNGAVPCSHHCYVQQMTFLGSTAYYAA